MALQISHEEFCSTWYLVSLVIIENFLTSWSLQQFQVKPSMNTRELKLLSLWGHRWRRSKLKPRLFTSYFNRANDRAKFDYWEGKKTLLLFRLYRLMTSIEGPWTCEVLTKKVIHFDQLRHWQKKLMLIEGCWSTSSNVLINYL